MLRTAPLLMLLACGQTSETDHAGEIGVIGSIETVGAHEVFSRRVTGTNTEIVVSDGVGERVLVSEGTPDRPVLSADGSQVAFVWGKSGYASIWTVPFSGGAPTQVTNVGLEHTPGRRPDGFVPVPHGDSLHFDGDWLRWSSPEGDHAEKWR